MAVRRSGCQGNAMGDKDDKAARLAKALRENLRKRKAQARELDQDLKGADGERH
jgi:hypothetical protein